MTYAFVPTEEDSAVDALAFTAELEALVEVFHECVALIDGDGLDGVGDVARLGAVHNLEKGLQSDVLLSRDAEGHKGFDEMMDAM